MKTKPNKIALAVFLLTICFALYAQQTVTDIDGNIYQTVTIGSQKWMKENLKTTHYNNGDSIANITDAAEWINITSGAYSNYNNDSNNVAVDGRLYNGFTVIDNRNLCPTGWHVPTDSDWIALTSFLGGESISGGKLKEVGTTHWNSPNSGATNASGFTALASGGRMYTDGTFQYIRQYGGWWSSTEQDDYIHIKYRNISYNENIVGNYSSPKQFGFSVRCIEDPIPDSAKYFGQTPPGNTAVIFAPGIISLTDRSEVQIAFSPDGKEIYFVAADGIYIQYKDNTWGPQIPAPVSGDAPFYSLDGKKIYLTIYTWNISHTEVTTSDIYEVDRNDGTWSQPIPLQAPVNSASYDGAYSQTADSTIYFNSNRSGSFELWRINPLTNLAETLGSIVNSTDASSPCVAPDGSYIVFGSSREGSIGDADLYITFKNADNSWTAPLNLNSGGSEINLADHSQIYPSLSPDGKYLFFNRHNWDGLLPDIYWVSTSIIDTLKTIAIPNSVDLIETNNLISVFPNPTTGRFTLYFESAPVQKVRVEIYNLHGVQVLERTILGSTSETIDLTDFSKGIYWIKINHEGSFYSNKLIVK